MSASAPAYRLGCGAGSRGGRSGDPAGRWRIDVYYDHVRTCRPCFALHGQIAQAIAARRRCQAQRKKRRRSRARD